MILTAIMITPTALPKGRGSIARPIPARMIMITVMAMGMGMTTTTAMPAIRMSIMPT
ncbi:MAG: hypothetical protein ACK4Y9_08235 [Hyphomonas sp.]